MLFNSNLRYLRVLTAHLTILLNTIHSKPDTCQCKPDIIRHHFSLALSSRHDGRVIWLTYKPEGVVKKTVYLVGQGAPGH